MTRIAAGQEVLRGERQRYGKDYQWFVHQRMDMTRFINYVHVSKPLSVNTILHELMLTMCINGAAAIGEGQVIIGLVGSPNPTVVEIEESETIIEFEWQGIKGVWLHNGCGVTENWIMHKTVLGGTKYLVIQLTQFSVNNIGLRVGIRFQEP